MRRATMCFQLSLFPRCRVHTLTDWWQSFHHISRIGRGSISSKVLASGKHGLEGRFNSTENKRMLTTKSEGKSKATLSRKTTIRHEILDETTKSKVDICSSEITEVGSTQYVDIRQSIAENKDLAKLMTFIIFDIETTGFSREHERIFGWLDQGPQITVYDSICKSFWALAFPEEMVATGNYFLGFSGGDFYFALYVKTAITVWHLKSNIRSRDALWVRKYVTDIETTVPIGLTGSLHIEVQNMGIHPDIPHIFYLDVKGKVISYDMETDIAELVHDFGEYGWRTKHFKLFSYEWHQWPRLL